MLLFAGTVPPKNTLFGGTVPPNSTLFGGTPDSDKESLISFINGLVFILRNTLWLSDEILIGKPFNKKTAKISPKCGLL